MRQKKKKKKGSLGINPEITPLHTALEELVERERECDKNFEAVNKKAKEDQKLARSIRKEAVETFAEIRARKLDENGKETGPSARKKSKKFW